MKQLVSLFFLLLLICACGQQTGISSEESNKKIPGEKIKAEVMKLVRHEVMDNKGTGIVASTYLLPEGWTANDKLYWEYNDATVPIRYKGVFRSAGGNMMIQCYPDVRSSWNTGPSGTWGYRPPNDIISGMKDLIREERKGKSIRYVDEKILSGNSKNGNQQGSQYRSISQTGVIKIQYEEQGQNVEEEFYGQLDVTDMITPSVMGNMESIIWSGNSLYSVKAVKGKLDECRKIAQTIKSSARLTKPFFNRLSQVIQMLSSKVYQQIYQAGQISKIISQTNDQMLASIDASYQQSQKAYDRINKNFSDYIRGVDRYSDGETQVQLPSGYDNAWVNEKGEYILTNTAGYDPSTDYNGNWRQLQKNQ